MQVNVLLIDAHPPSALSLESVLQPLGYRLVTADSAAAALRLLAREHFTAILSDVRMPGTDGFEMLARLRGGGLTRQTAVVFFSTVDDREAARRAFELGAVDFIVKPYDPDLLRLRIRALVSLCRQREPVAALSHAPEEMVAAAAPALAVAEEAERLLRSKDTFLAVVGHDLRTPLGTMRYGCTALSHDSSLSACQRSTLALLDRAIDRMSRMVTDIVDFARTSAGGGFPIRPRTTNLADVITTVVDEIKGAHPDRPIDVSIADQLFAACDADRIAQATANLVVNAVEHGEGSVRISAESQRDEVVVEVHNGGPPIPADAIPTLFDAFAGRAEHSAGLGLGLYIVHEIARSHGGTVQVRSSATHGTTFEMRWPRWLAGSGAVVEPANTAVLRSRHRSDPRPLANAEELG
jgi:signal transduction histidine kinase